LEKIDIGVAQEMPRQIGSGEEHGRCLAGELSEVADQMRLVIVSARDSRISPAGALLLDGLKDPLEAAHSRKVFGAQSNGVLKSPLQLAQADS
jgi:hypothetical protein